MKMGKSKEGSTNYYNTTNVWFQTVSKVVGVAVKIPASCNMNVNDIQIIEIYERPQNKREG